MHLFFDVDGVLLNFEKAFVRFLNDRKGKALPEDYETDCWFFSEILKPEEMRAAWLGFLDSEYSAEIPPLVAPEKFNTLSHHHTVHLLTNFPIPYKEKRERNLRDLGMKFDSLHYCGLHSFKGEHPSTTKSEKIDQLRANGEAGFFIDDQPDNCLDVLENCESVDVWLMSRRFNLEFSHPEISRADAWEILFDHLGNGSRG